MYLKSLEMQGFKSFPDKTKLVFDNAVSVELAPETPSAHGVTVGNVVTELRHEE